jgi:hypothetical protein
MWFVRLELLGDKGLGLSEFEGVTTARNTTPLVVKLVVGNSE